MTQRIFLSPPHMSGLEQAYVDDAFTSNWLTTMGPNVAGFEREFAARLGLDEAQAVGVASGTAALHLALILAGVGPGDTVLVSDFTFCASVNPIVYLGARPVLIDAEERSWNMDPGALIEALQRCAARGELPKALVLVHLYGQAADIDAVAALCAEFGVPLIEDAAEALGATYKGRAPGTFGRFGIYSFNGNKIITTTGGGMLVGASADEIAHARKLATHAREIAPHYQHNEVGYNYRLSNVLAGIGRGQLHVLDERVRARRRIFEHYRQGLGDLPGVDFMPEAPWGTSSRWLTCILVDPATADTDRDAIRRALEADDIESRPTWKPMHAQPVFKDCEFVGSGVCDRLFRLGLCLPSGTAMTDDDLDRVIGIVRGCWPGKRAVTAPAQDGAPARTFPCPTADDVRSVVERELAALPTDGEPVAIVSTTARDSQSLAVLPRRELWNLRCASFLVSTEEAATRLLDALDGRVRTVLVDVERKKSFDLYGLAGTHLRKSRRASYKPNDATAVAADELFCWAFDDDLSGREVLIYGLGNLGSKLALRLAERGARVRVHGRNATKVRATARALSAMLPRFSAHPIQAVDRLEDLEPGSLDGVITFLSQRHLVDGRVLPLLKPGALVADGGIDNFEPSFFPAAIARGMRCLRLDVRLGAPYSLLAACDFTDQFFRDVLGRCERNGVSFVAGGMIGARGEVILDQIQNPRQVIGIANGTGGLVPTSLLTPDDKDKLKLAEELIRGGPETAG